MRIVAPDWTRAEIRLLLLLPLLFLKRKSTIPAPGNEAGWSQAAALSLSSLPRTRLRSHINTHTHTHSQTHTWPVWRQRRGFPLPYESIRQTLQTLCHCVAASPHHATLQLPLSFRFSLCLCVSVCLSLSVPFASICCVFASLSELSLTLSRLPAVTNSAAFFSLAGLRRFSYLNRLPHYLFFFEFLFHKSRAEAFFSKSASF